MSEKIKPHHQARKAILYVRQSSTYQVLYNEESRRLQYAMRERLEHLGWGEIEVIDEDLGCSAAGTVERRGFERMVAEVCLGKVGAGFVPGAQAPGQLKSLDRHDERPMVRRQADVARDLSSFYR